MAATLVATGRAATVQERLFSEDDMQLLTATSTILLSLPQQADGLQRLAAMLVPQLGDWCAILTLDDSGQLQPAAVAHADPCCEQLVTRLQRNFPLSADLEHPLQHALHFDETVVASEIADPKQARLAGNAAQLRLLRALGIVSYLIVPCRGTDGVCGLLLLVSSQPERRYLPDDLPFVEVLGHNLAQALAATRVWRQLQCNYTSTQEALRRRDEELAALVHDLRGPLGVVDGRVQLALRLLEGLDAPEAAGVVQQLSMADQALQQMHRRIDTLFEVVRRNSIQRRQPQRRLADLVPLVHRCASDYQLTSTRHSLVVDAEPESIIGYWDTELLERIVGNLLNNAIKYSPRGLIRIGIYQSQSSGTACALLTVSDQGIGIPAGEMKQIFSPFYRASNVAGQIRGTGLGLAIVAELVDAHGGTISVSSEERRGATFTVQLPLR